MSTNLGKRQDPDADLADRVSATNAKIEYPIKKRVRFSINEVKEEHIVNHSVSKHAGGPEDLKQEDQARW